MTRQDSAIEELHVIVFVYVLHVLGDCDMYVLSYLHCLCLLAGLPKKSGQYIYVITNSKVAGAITNFVF